VGELDYTPIGVARAARRLDVALAGMHLDLAQRMSMTPTELLALDHLGMDGELSPTDLARRLRMHSGAVTALVDRLTAHGHVSRVPHPSDRRKLVVRLTDAGRAETMRQLGPMVDDVVALVARLPKADRTTVGRFVDDLAELVAGRAKPEDGPAAAAADDGSRDAGARQRARDAT
jgi:DNA-binding MarR family transcriptional regulator